ncbi:MAG: hypothetical protein K6E49_02060 [Lachnospiraceae bacterium]|nr:hypothetical protein [Lachnospiraceae bacterium]
MAFYSLAFFGFVLIFFVLHCLLGDFFPKYQWIARLMAGIAFFLYLSGFKIVFVLISAVSIWGGALIISGLAKKNKEKRSREGITKEEKKLLRKKDRKVRMIWTALIVIINLGLLIFSKYILPVTNHPIALPIGISFYSLQAVSYIVDIYGDKYEPQRNFGKVLLYLVWFPQLIQGPINRYDLIRDDLYKNYRICAPEFRYAFYVFLFGAVKKYAIADVLAPFVNASLNNDSSGYPGSFALFGALMFAIRQYADFSGGIDMSMAVSLLFGVKMNENFRQPYFSTSLAQFWRRWHITLGSWMRDYVFYPFVTTKPVSNMTKKISSRFGAHAGRAVTGGISNLIVFALVGLWHGPEKHFICWGLYNGLIIAVSDALSPLFSKMNTLLHINTDSKAFYGFRIFRTFMIVVFAGYFDVIGPVRTGLSCFVNTLFNFDLSGGVSMIGQLFTDGITSVEAVVTASVAALLLFVNSVYKETGHSPVRSLCSRHYLLRWVVCFSLMGLLLYSFTVSSDIRGFMYAAF